MNEIQNIDGLTAEILILKQQTAQNIIEIGKRLLSVKESLPHGEWGKYLDSKVDFSQQTAQRFMKVATEFSNTSTLRDLGQSKVFALLSLPQEERETFVKENPVNEMTAKQLQEAIKEKKNLETKLKSSEKAKSVAEVEKEKIKKELDSIENKNREALTNKEVEIENLKIAFKDVNRKLLDAEASGNDKEVERLQSSLKEMQSDLDNSAQKIDELEAQINSKTIDVITAEPAVIEKVPDEVQKELEELRKKSRQGSNPLIEKFKGNYTLLNQIFRNELEVMAQIKGTDTETYEKCKRNILNLINSMSEHL